MIRVIQALSETYEKLPSEIAKLPMPEFSFNVMVHSRWQDLPEVRARIDG